MKKRLRQLTLTLLSAAVLSGNAGSSYAAPPAPGTVAGASHIKAVTYAGRDWVINFWSTETDYMAEDFARIREDGFNTVIVCVPWREFQPYAQGGLNDYAVKKLRTIFETAAETGLSVMLRLGYTWDYYDNSDVLERYKGLIYDRSWQDAWERYTAEIYGICASYDNFSGAFLTWEDFWNFAEEGKTLAGTYRGAMLAERMGYTAYVKSMYSKEELTLLYKDAALAEEASFPAPDTPALKLFYEWYDTVLNRILRDTQKVFPGISLECRLDQDPYPNTEAEPAFLGYNHGATFRSEAAPFTSLMLSAAMGFSEGQVLPAGEVLAMSEAQLARFSAQAGGKPVFVDQFLYMETTPGYENHPKLAETEINAYLSGMGKILKKRTAGYGIWTYRDYADSIIYNGEFGRELTGWSTYGNVSIVEHDGSKMAKLKRGSVLRQDLSGRNYLGSGKTKISFRAVAEKPVMLTVRIGAFGRTSVTAEVSGDSTVTIEFPLREREELSIEAQGEVLIDEIKLYTHLTEGGIYRMDGSEGPYLSGIRACNRNIG